MKTKTKENGLRLEELQQFEIKKPEVIVGGSMSTDSGARDPHGRQSNSDTSRGNLRDAELSGQ